MKLPGGFIAELFVVVGVFHISAALQIPCENFLQNDTPIEELINRAFRFTESEENSPCYEMSEVENPGLFDVSGAASFVGDDEAVEAPLGFSFPFFGERFSSVFPSSNGFITMFGTEMDFDVKNREFRNRTGIYPFTRDLNPQKGNGPNFNGTIYYKALSEKSYGIQYFEVPVYQFQGRNTFQVIIESSGDITVSYGFIDFSPRIIGVSPGKIDAGYTCLPEQISGQDAGVIVEEDRLEDPFVCFDNALSATNPETPSFLVHYKLPELLPPYSAKNTNGAQNENSVPYEFQVCSGTFEFQFSVCPEDGGKFSGDTVLKLYRGHGDIDDLVNIQTNDDGCADGSVGSKLKYMFDVPCEECHNFTLSQGCYEDSGCSGDVEFEALKSAPLEMCPAWLPPYLLPAYDIHTPETVVDFEFTVCGGTHNLIFATCELPGAEHAGDTNLVLLDSEGIILTLDTPCPQGGGSVINHDFYMPCGQCQNFTLRQGCNGNNLCNGTVGFVPEIIDYTNFMVPAEGVICGASCDNQEITDVSYISCDFFQGSSETGVAAPDNCFYNASSNQMCYRPTETGHYSSYFHMTDSDGDSIIATQTVQTEGLVADGICLWQTGCAGDPRGCEAGTFCMEYPWWSQCQENKDIPQRNFPSGEPCYATNNGGMGGRRWGCDVDSDCCNPGATCGRDRLCYLPCMARERSTWSGDEESSTWWNWSTMDKKYQVSIAAVSSAAVLLVVVGAAMWFFSKQKLSLEQNLNVVVDTASGFLATPQQSFDEQDDMMYNHKVMIGDSIIPDEDQI